MSASREKKNRQNQINTAPVTTEKKGMSKCLKRTIAVVVSVILVAAIVFLGMVSTSFFEKHTTAMVSGNHKLTPAMLNYFYVNGYNEMSSYVGSYINSELPLSEQEYPGDKFETWADYFIDYAANDAAETYAIYDDAVANGFTLSETGKQSIESELSMTELYAQFYGYTANAMVAGNFGTGCTMKSYEEYLTVTALVDEYLNAKNSELTYTGIEINEYYAEHRYDIDGVTFRYFLVSPSTLDQAEGEEDMTACEETANAIAEAAAAGEEAYLEAVAAYMTEEAAATAETSTLLEDYNIPYCPDEFQDWLADEARAEGDVCVIAEGERGYAVLYYIRPEYHDYQLPNVRHILISVEAGADETAKAEAEKKAQDILDQYLAGEQTEDAFAELAKSNSSDSNAASGGLYTNIIPGYMSEPFEAWCYDEARQVGDTGIVETEHGYHVMYFSGFGQVYRDYLVESLMRTNDYSAWRSSVVDDVDYTITDNAARYMIEI